MTAADSGAILGAALAMYLLGSLIAWVIGFVLKISREKRMYIAFPVAVVLGAFIYSFNSFPEDAFIYGLGLYSIGAVICAFIVFAVSNVKR